MTFPLSPFAICLALASTLGLFTLRKPQLFVCLFVAISNPRVKLELPGAVLLSTQRLTSRLYTPGRYAPHTVTTQDLQLETSAIGVASGYVKFSCIMHYCTMPPVPDGSVPNPASFIDQVLSAAVSWSGERCLLLGVLQCGNGLSHLTTPSRNVRGELPPRSLLCLAQQQHRSPVREQGASHPGRLLLPRAETASPRRDPLLPLLHGKLCQAKCAVSEPGTHLTDGVPAWQFTQVVLASPAPALTPADAVPPLYIAPRICRKHLQIRQGQGITAALPCSSNSSHGLLEKMASGLSRAKSDGNGLPKAAGNQRPPGAHLRPKVGLCPSPESPWPSHLPGSCATPLRGRAGTPMWQAWWRSVDSPLLCEMLPSCQTAPLLCYKRNPAMTHSRARHCKQWPIHQAELGESPTAREGLLWEG